MALETELFPGLRLRDPIMVASSHRTESKKMLAELSEHRPSAVTLKSTSPSQGGPGVADFESRKHNMLRNADGGVLGFYSDGPPLQELLDVATSRALLADARHLLPDTKVGISVLQPNLRADPNSKRNDYEMVATVFAKGSIVDFFELNLKYSFRGLSLADMGGALAVVQHDIEHFFQTFNSHPILVKLPRELTQLLDQLDFSSLWSLIAKHQAGLIIANSLRTVVPPSRTNPKSPSELSEGVLTGEPLFLDTYRAIKTVRSQVADLDVAIPIVASGGILDVAAIIDVVAAGAVAVQVCSVLDLRRAYVLQLLQQRLEAIVDSDWSSFLNGLRDNESQWYAATKRALETQAPASEKADKLLDAPEPFASVLTSVLRDELSIDPDLDLKEPPAGTPVNEETTAVITFGNAASCLLMSRAVDHFRIRELQLKSSYEFSRKLRDQDFRWDVAILPKSRLDQIDQQSQAIPEGIRPIRVATIAESIVELVGLKGTNLNALQVVYHFGGATARNALNALLQEADVPEQAIIKSEDVLQLLEVWPANNALLTKPPLSRLYGNVTSKPARWSSLWCLREPLFLVARNGFLQGTGSGQVITLYDHLVQEREQALQNLSVAINYVRRTGFLTYVREILKGRI